MTNAIRVTPAHRSAVPRREYRNPPVHEVILDVQFQRSLEEPVLRELRGRLTSYPQAEQQNLMQVQMAVGPSGAGYQNMLSQFGGWVFRRDGWVLQTAPMSLALHLVRPGAWPTGSYLGWTAIYDEYLSVHAALQDAYGALEPKRAGLRYLNRIAIPQGEDVNDWLEFKVTAPDVLRDLYAFNLRQTWARAGDHPDISATVGLAKIEVGDQALAAANQGVLIDIDVFNLWPETAPPYQRLPDWFARAHEVENEIFEGCVTERLRQRFDNP